MAQSQVTLAFGAGFAWQESALGATVMQIKATGATVFIVEIDNTANLQDTVYVKGWLALAAGVTLGTTAPNFVLPCPGGQKIAYSVKPGTPYATALSVACVKEPGTAGTTPPSSAVLVKVAYS